MLQHQPLHANVVFGMTPITQCIHIAHVKALLKTLRNIRQTPTDFAGNKGLSTAFAFMVKQNAVAGVDTIGLSVVDRHPVRIQFGNCIGAARVKRRCFPLRRFVYQAIQLRSTCLIEPRFFLQPQNTDGFEQAKCSHGIHI